MAEKANIQAFFFDALQVFADNGTNLTATGVLGTFVDLKGVGYAGGSVVVDVSAIDFGDANETYDLVVELGLNDAGYVEFASFPLLAVGRVFLPVTNQRTTMFDSMRLSLTLAGTTPDITLGAFLTDKVPMADS
ncbi:MAG TPA: hypothetical protein EYN51_06415 [Flavobacteriales bacterium]|nr:hypothetical protein [Flavobacteriales bacterium]